MWNWITFLARVIKALALIITTMDEIFWEVKSFFRDDPDDPDPEAK